MPFHLTANYRYLLIYLLLVILFLFFLSDLLFGSVNIPISQILKILFGGSSNYSWKVIIMDFRLPKAVAGILAGMALSVSGLQMQTLFRNPLAGPDVLGISSGASLGVALMVLGISPFFSTHLSSILGNGALVISACIGAAGTLILVMVVSSLVRDILTILILGILIGSGISSVVSILQYFGNEALLKLFVVWTLGSLGQISKVQLAVMAPCIAFGLLLSFLSTKKLNALLLGEKYATTLGLNVKTTRLLIFASTSILAGSTTAFCGPIAFIGIAVPHLSRNIFKTSDHKILILSSMLIGAIVLLFSDIISQLPGSNYTLPVNSITALLGIPIVIWIIIRNRKKNFW